MPAIREHIVNDSSELSEQRTTDSEQIQRVYDNENMRIPLTISMEHFEDAIKKVRRYVTVKNTSTNLSRLE
jgi:hypothetical protein